MSKLFRCGRVTGPVASKGSCGLFSNLSRFLVLFVALVVPALAWSDYHEPSLKPDMVCHWFKMPYDFCSEMMYSSDSSRDYGETTMLIPCKGYVCGSADSDWFPVRVELYR